MRDSVATLNDHGVSDVCEMTGNATTELRPQPTADHKAIAAEFHPRGAEERRSHREVDHALARPLFWNNTRILDVRPRRARRKTFVLRVAGESPA